MIKKRLIFITIILASVSMQAQPWQKNTNPTFFDLQKEFYEYWKNNPNPGGSGYNVFKRWEWFWQPRVGQTGEFPPLDNDYREWEKYSRNLKRSGEPVWRCLGPFNTPSGYNGMGRVNCIAFHPTDKNTFWVGTPAGGLWKTTDFGSSWTTNTDKNPVLGVSSMVVHPNFPDSLYIATGDGDRGSLSGMTAAPRGDSKSIGILRSSDGGNTWYPTGLNWNLSQAKLIRKLIIHPFKPWILLCAASDGVYRTADAGKTWTNVSTGYYMDISFKPDNPDVVYATTFTTGGNGNAKVFRSLNGGLTFTSVYTIPDGSRITMGVTPANSSKVHLLVSHKGAGQLEGIYQSLDSGTNFSLLYDTLNLLANTYDGSGVKGQGWYDLSYNILPNDENTIFVGGVNTWKSTDGGNNFELNNMWTGHPSINPYGVTTVHADKHHFTTHPLDNSIIFDCNDGGVYYSNDMGFSWVDISENLVITQFYRIAITDQDTGIVLGGTQDNGSRILNSQMWGEATGGDGMEVAIDPVDPDVMYSSYAYGRLYRNDYGFQSWGTETISENIPGNPEGAWVTPFLIDPVISTTIYAGYKQLFKSTDQGYNWVSISDSLTAPYFLQNIAVAPGNNQVIYMGDFYNIFRTTDGGTNWKKIVISTSAITNIKVSPFNPMIFYYTCSGYTAGNKVFRYDGTITQGNPTTNMSGNLPNVSINCVVYYKGKPEALYIGTDVGIFYRDSTLNDWITLNGNMPNTVVTDIEINDVYKKLVAGTYGRGIWQSDLFGVTYPKVTSLVPAHNSISVSRNTPVKINYDVNVKKGAGKIDIFENNILKCSMNVDSVAVVVNQNNVTVNHGLTFAYSSSVDVKVSTGAFKDMSGNNALGIGTGQWEFTIEDISWIKGITGIEGLKFYPNPASSIIVFEFSKEEVNSFYEISDISGKILQDGTLGALKNEVSIDGFSSGLYFVRLRLEGSEHVFKLIIDKG